MNDLQIAWDAFHAARKQLLAAILLRATTKASLSETYRERGGRVTVDMVQSYYLSHPKYIAATQQANDADEQYWRAVAALEAAWTAHGLPGQRFNFDW